MLTILVEILLDPTAQNAFLPRSCIFCELCTHIAEDPGSGTG